VTLKVQQEFLSAIGIYSFEDARLSGLSNTINFLSKIEIQLSIIN